MKDRQRGRSRTPTRRRSKSPGNRSLGSRRSRSPSRSLCPMRSKSPGRRRQNVEELGLVKVSSNRQVVRTSSIKSNKSNLSKWSLGKHDTISLAKTKSGTSLGSKAVSSFTAHVTSIYNKEKRTKDLTDMKKVLTEVRDLTTQADAMELTQNYGSALEKHIELQQLVMATLSDDIPISSHENMILYFALAESSSRMSFIYESYLNDLEAAEKQCKRTFHYFQRLHEKLIHAGYCSREDATDPKVVREKFEVNREITIKTCRVMLDLSRIYLRQEKWGPARQSCLDALDSIGFGLCNNVNENKAQVPEELLELKELILENLKEAEKKSLNLRTSSGKGLERSTQIHDRTSGTVDVSHFTTYSYWTERQKKDHHGKHDDDLVADSRQERESTRDDGLGGLLSPMKACFMCDDYGMDHEESCSSNESNGASQASTVISRFLRKPRLFGKG